MTDILTALTLLDIGVLILLGIGMIQGLFRGLSGELASVLGMVAAFFCATLLHEPLGRPLARLTGLDPRPVQAVTFITTVLIAFAVMLVCRIWFRKAIRLIIAGPFDKAAGVVAGFSRMTLVIALAIMVLNMLPYEPLRRYTAEDSLSGRLLIRHIPTVERTLEHAGWPIRKRQADSP